MFVLVVDTATPAVTAAVARVAADGAVTLLAERVTVNARAHGELLAPAVSAVLAEAGIEPAELTAVVAGVGPGPFTGLRVGLVTAAALGHALGIPTYGVCSLDALGLDAAGSGLGPGAGGGGSGTVLVATDARRREVYWAVYSGRTRLSPASVDRPDEVARRAVELGAGFAVGDGALLYAGVLGLPVSDEPRYPSAAALAALAGERVRTGAPSEPLTPLYLRRPDAVAPGERKPVLR